MGQVTIVISEEEAKMWGNVGLLVSNPIWFKKHGLDWQKPTYITFDENSKFYYIDAWELEDDKKEED